LRPDRRVGVRVQRGELPRRGQPRPPAAAPPAGRRRTLSPVRVVFGQNTGGGPGSEPHTRRDPFGIPSDRSPVSDGLSRADPDPVIRATGGDVITDEDGLVVAFLAEDDVDDLLNDPRFGAVAMPILALSGVTEGPLFDLWSELMFGKDGEDHKR